jgi:hypothetical protein
MINTSPDSHDPDGDSTVFDGRLTGGRKGIPYDLSGFSIAAPAQPGATPIDGLHSGDPLSAAA